MKTTLIRRSPENVNLEVPRKILRKSSPLLRRRNVSSLQTFKIIFEFGPHQLNLFRYITKKSGILWKDANEKWILKNGGKPTDGLILICEDDEGTVNTCLKMAGFDVYKYERLEENSVMNDERKSVCIFYFGEQFWKTMNKSRVQTIREAVRKVTNTYVFFITTSDVERDEAVECCKRFKLCPISHVISPASDKTAFYEAFYNVLENELHTFSSDLEIRTSTRQIYSTKCKLNFFLEKLRSRNASIKSPLTKKCLEIIKTSSKNGVIGYRLLGNELHIYENEHLRNERERRSEIENCIKNNFKGEVHFRPLNKVLKPQCTVRCGDYLRNDTLGIMGTIGMFGEMNNTVDTHSIHTVALSSPHVISSGDVAGTSTGERIGECIWPGSKANIHDVSIIKIDPSVINSLQRTHFNENITVEERPYGSLRYRDVVKYGATTGETRGSIEQINDFQLFDRDVMAISSDDPENPFSTNGDSGAIVLTIIDGKHYGIGVIYGGSLEDREAKSSITENESIAIFLKKAIDKFTAGKNVTIEFDKI
nr:uncharacterized protein LOC117685919 isoform X2 [Crassostrea gigas]